mmetsp:Transcript_10422/g.47034  ORF Transcript_10422/g.47034 Transcript_10422/m.47034 type:complete len:301 (+) Transcript_10422:843-1745(+)
MTRTTAHLFSTLYMATTLSPGLHSICCLACRTAAITHRFAAVGARDSIAWSSMELSASSSLMGSPETTTGMSPRVTMSCRATCCPRSSRSLNPIACLARLGTTPTTMGTAGLYLAIILAASPFAASTTMHAALTFAAVITVDDASASIVDSGAPWMPYSDIVLLSKAWDSAQLSTHCSASSQMPAMISTASRGYAPAAVSPESITQSVPSRTALATSVASARVGRGAPVMDSSIWVAVMTGLPLRLAFRIIIFWTQNIRSRGISMPRSPRATMTPSVYLRMSSKFAMPSSFSILEMILTL